MLSITGGQTLSGAVAVSGSKNASLPILAAALLVDRATIRNVPRIGDVFTFLRVFESFGVEIDFSGNTVVIDTRNMRAESDNPELIKKIRVGIFLVPVLLRRFGRVSIPYPGGCNLGKRPIDEHIRAFEAMGYMFTQDDDRLVFEWVANTGDLTFSAGFSVGATENILIANAFRPGKSRIELAATEPHVMDLVAFLRMLGVEIAVHHDHVIALDWYKKNPDSAEYTVIHDYLETGTFAIFAALCADSHVDIYNARIDDLASFLSKAREAGVRYEVLDETTLRVYRSREYLRAVKIQTNIYPGFPTDLQSPFAILMTQAEGVSRIQEMMFEGRLNMLIEIEKMKGHSAVLNPHEALVFGPTRLRGTTVSSWDLRSGVSMIIAALVAEGETTITNVEYIERGYEDIIGKLEALGATIGRVEG